MGAPQMPCPVLDALSAGLVTLDGYARRHGYSSDTVAGARRRHGDFPQAIGRLRPAPGARGRGRSVYARKALDRFFAAHPVLPVLAEPLPEGLITLHQYGQQAGRPAALTWGSRPGFPGPVGQLSPSRRRVYREAEIGQWVTGQPTAGGGHLDMAGRTPDDRISLTAFAKNVAHTRAEWLIEQRRMGNGFLPAGPDGRYRLGQLAAFYASLTAASAPGRVPAARDPVLVELGAELARARRAAGLSQRGLASVAGCSRSVISEMEIGRSPAPAATWRDVDQALGAGGVLAARHNAWVDGGIPPGPGACMARLGPVTCGQDAPWLITVLDERSRAELPACEQCQPSAWALAVRRHAGQVGQVPARAAGWDWAAGRCSCCGQRAPRGTGPPACAACASAGCDIEAGRRGCGATGPPPARAGRARPALPVAS